MTDPTSATAAAALHKICDDWEDSDYLDISRFDAQEVVHAARSAVTYQIQRDQARGETEAATRALRDLPTQADTLERVRALWPERTTPIWRAAKLQSL